MLSQPVGQRVKSWRALVPSHRRMASDVAQISAQRPHRRQVAPHAPVRPSARQTVETPTAPGSNSNFTGLPKDGRDVPVTTPVSDPQMQEHIETVRNDFQLVFKDVMDRNNFESKTYFRDPITTNFNSFRVYQFIVQFLRYFLAPIFELHEVRQAGESAILIKWSWTMNFWWNRYDPLKFLWDPRLVFTGITVLGYNRETGKWNKHVDAWDAVENNEFFSPEAWIFAFSQMFQVSKPPNRFTPEFQVYKKYKGWEIRRYRRHLRAEVSLAELRESDDAVGKGPGIQAQWERAQRDKAEVLLERYLALGNDREEFFKLTTPLFVTHDDVFSLMVPGYQNLEDLPRPHKAGLVKLKEQPEGFYATVRFSGSPSAEDIKRRLSFLRAALEGDGCRPASDDWVFARYSKDSWPLGPFRCNDVLIPLEEDSVDLWRGVDWEFIDRIVAHEV